MLSTMMNVPLTTAAILRHGERVNATARVRTLGPDGSVRSGTFADVGRRSAQLAHALLAHQLHHRLRIRQAIGLAAPTLVIRLTAVAHMLASPLHAQPCDEVLREDLPKGFFTTRTP